MTKIFNLKKVNGVYTYKCYKKIEILFYEKDKCTWQRTSFKRKPSNF